MGLSGAWLRLRHLLTARGRHSIHSPFVYEWYNQVCLSRQGTWEQRMESYFAEKGMTIHWMQMEEPMPSLPESAEVIVVQNIHTSHAHHRRWKVLAAKTNYEVCIVLPNRALLIRRPEQARQVFVLR